MSITVFKRYERKFITDEETMQDLLPVLLEYMEPDYHCQLGQSYHICNIYYDTLNNDVIRDSLQHPYYKEKLRLRSYGIPENDDTLVFLELKKKVNGQVTKRRAQLRYGAAKRFLQDRTIPDDVDYLNCQILREIAYYLSHTAVRPSVYLSYDRIAFFSKEDPSFRLTFDCNIRTRRGLVSFEDDVPAELLLSEHFRLMEVKVSSAYPKWFADLISETGVYRHSFSKYGVEYKSYLKNQISTGLSINILSHI